MIRMHAQTDGRYVSIKSEDNSEIKAEDQSEEKSFAINNKLDEKPKPSVTNLTWFPASATPFHEQPRQSRAPPQPWLSRLPQCTGQETGSGKHHRWQDGGCRCAGQDDDGADVGQAVLQIWAHKYGHVTDAAVEEVIGGINQREDAVQETEKYWKKKAKKHASSGIDVKVTPVLPPCLHSTHWYRSRPTTAKITPGILGPGGLFRDIPDLQALGLASSTPRSLYESFLAGKQPDVLSLADLFGKLAIPKKKKNMKKTSRSGDGYRNEAARRGGKTPGPIAGNTQGRAENGKRGGRVQKAVSAGYVSTEREGKRQRDSKMRTSLKRKIEVVELDVETRVPAKREMEREAEGLDDVKIKMKMDLDLD